MANFKEIDPELGSLNLSKGGDYPVEYALRLACRVWLADMHVTISLGEDHGRGPSPPERFGVQLSHCRYGCVEHVVEADHRQWPHGFGSGPAHAARARSGGASRLPKLFRPAVRRRLLRFLKRLQWLPRRDRRLSRSPRYRPLSVKVKVAVEPPPPAPPKPVVVSDPVQERILALVVEKTGYPKDMLDLDLDLEADLGVDTVKQAELLAAIRGIYNIERDQNLKLRDFPTLKHVIGFVYSKRPDLAVAEAKAVQQAAVQPQIVAAAPGCRQRLRSSPSPSIRCRKPSWHWWWKRPAIPRTCWTWTGSRGRPRG